MPSVKFRAAMSESKSICGPLYIDFNSDWFALWFLRIKYVLKGNLLCWVVEFLDLVIFLHKGDFHILCQILGVDHRSQNYLRGIAHNINVAPGKFDKKNKRSPIYSLYLYYLNRLYEVRNKALAPEKKSEN